MDKLYRPIIKEGTHLARSKSTDGAFRGSQLSDETNQIDGQAEWILVEEDIDSDSDKSETLVYAFILAAGVLSTIAVQKATPYLKKWWNETAYPSIKHRLCKLIGKEERVEKLIEKKSNKEEIIEIANLKEITTASFSKEIDLILEEDFTINTNREVQERLVSILGAAAFIADEIRKLSKSIICDESQYLEVQDAFEKLTTQKVTDSINIILESNTSLLDEKTSAIILNFFSGGMFIDGEYVPIENKRVREVLRLSQ